MDPDGVLARGRERGERVIVIDYHAVPLFTQKWNMPAENRSFLAQRQSASIPTPSFELQARLAMNTTSRPPLTNSFRVEVARTSEQIAHAFAIRSICFMEDEGYRANHAFDGNDYQCTHFVIYDGDEPIGASRVRWFKDFAKIERTAFRKAYRNVRVLRDTSRFIFDHAAMKGYDRIVTVAEEHYARVWMRILGFTLLDENPVSRPGQTSKFYLLEKRVDVPEHAIRPDTPINVMIRTEGAWDKPLSFG